MIIDILWSHFFKAKYVKKGHIALVETPTKGSRLWRAMMLVFSEVCENVKVSVKEGRAFF